MQGTQARKLMADPKHWQVRVWENLGWHWNLRHIPSGGMLTVNESLPGRHYALLSLTLAGAGDYRWHSNKTFKHPQVAVSHTIGLAALQLHQEQEAFAKVRNV